MLSTERTNKTPIRVPPFESRITVFIASYAIIMLTYWLSFIFSTTTGPAYQDIAAKVNAPILSAVTALANHAPSVIGKLLGGFTKLMQIEPLSTMLAATTIAAAITIAYILATAIAHIASSRSGNITLTDNWEHNYKMYKRL